jgi:hypothetical protein
MPVRFPFRRVRLSPGSILYPYWGALGFFRPVIDVFTVGPAGKVVRAAAQVDSASDYVALDPGVAVSLGLQPPFSRQFGASGAGGHRFGLTFPPDGTVSLFITDYREWYYLPAPLVGFHVAPSGAALRSVLGLNGFLQQQAD